MKIKPTSILLCVAVLIVLALMIIDMGEPAEPAKAAITNVQYPETATGGDHIGLSISATIKNVGGTRGIFGVISQPDYARTEGLWIEPGDECIFTYIAGVYMPNHDYDIQLQAYHFINGSYRIDDSENITILADELTTFQEQCLNNGVVTCEWEVLKQYLENHIVSRVWWNLTEVGRRSVAEKAIRNTHTLFATFNFGRSGKPNCEGGEGDYVSIVCTQNAIIRYLKSGRTIDILDPSTKENVGCYFKQWSSDTEEFCYGQEPYNLPCHTVSGTEHSDGPGWAHAMCAIQVREGYDSLDNWIIFQYASFDIKPGDSQMPYNKKIKMYDLTSVHCNGGLEGECIAEFDT
jgi:hypothetical protein